MTVDNTAVRQTLTRMSNAFGKIKDPKGTLDVWCEILCDDRYKVQPGELYEAVTEFIRRTENTHGFPRPAQILNVILKNRPPAPYRQSAPEGDYGPHNFKYFIEAFIAAGGDPEELKRVDYRRLTNQQEVGGGS